MMTDKEFLSMMLERYHIEDFDDASKMCEMLSRFAKIAIEISEQYEHKYGENNERALTKVATNLSICSDAFRKAYLDERI